VASREEEERERIKKLVEEELAARKKLADLQKSMNQDIATYLQQNLNILEGVRKIKELEDEINELKQEGGEVNEEIVKQREKELAEMKRINEEAKQLNSLTKSIGNQIKKGINEGLTSLNNKLANSIPGFYEIFDTLMAADLAVRELTRDLGASGGQAEALESAMFNAASYAAALGVSVEQLARSQYNFAEQTGRAVVFSKELNESVVRIAQGTGISVENTGAFLGNISKVGLSIYDTEKIMNNVVNQSSQLGLNSRDVVESMTQNVKLISRLNFNNGIDGLTKLVQVSKKFRLEMSEIESLANKIFRPEGAIELAANLQMLGGAFSRLGDPFTLMYRARNAPEELANSIAKATAESAIFNEQTGEFKVSALELDRLRQVAEATGLSYETLRDSAIQAAKDTRIRSQFRFNFDKETLDFVSNIAEFNKDKGGFTITMPDGTPRLLKDLTTSQIQMIKSNQKDLEARAKAAASFDKAFGRLIESLKTAFLPLVNMLDSVTAFIADLSTSFGKEGTIGKVLLSTLALGGATLATMFTAKLLTAGVSKIGGLMSSAIGKIPGLGGTGGAGGGFFSGFFEGLSKVSVSKLLAFGAAMVGVGYGASLAAGGLADLVKSFSGLDVPQIIGATVAIGAFGYGLMALIPAIVSVGMAATVGAPGLLALGASIALVGGGVWLAATGMSSLVESFKGFSAGEILAIGGSMLMLGGSIGLLTASLVAAGVLWAPALVGVGVLTAGILALGTAINAISAGSLDNLTELTSISDERINKLLELFNAAAKAKPLTVTVEGSATIGGEISVEGMKSQLLTDEFVKQLSNKILETIKTQEQILIKGSSSGNPNLSMGNYSMG
tara:strand:- start:6472 stop:9009 length:2538 start_codon:yes stop_codon:yes gene_type:complete